MMTSPFSFLRCLTACSILFLTLLLAACGETTSSGDTELQGKLSADLVHNPRSLDTASSPDEAAIMVFSDTVHDFGRLKEGETVTYDFSFTNKGKRDLIISEAKGSCGCTVPSFPRSPIRSGQSDAIQVTFNSAGKKGYNEKTVMVITNANPSILNLTIRAEVY